jgi:hypothetical protein
VAPGEFRVQAAPVNLASSIGAIVVRPGGVALELVALRIASQALAGTVVNASPNMDWTLGDRAVNRWTLGDRSREA